MYIVEIYCSSIGVFTNFEKMIDALEDIISKGDYEILYVNNLKKTFTYKNTNKHLQIRKLIKNKIQEIN